jgi:hypothetical protein
MNRSAFGWVFALVTSTVLATTGSAGAEVKFEGDWPKDEKPVSLDVKSMGRTEAIRKVAEARGWDVVVFGANDPVDIQVKDVPVLQLLEILLADGKYVAKRSGKLVAIAKDGSASAEAKPDASGAAMPQGLTIPAFPALPSLPSLPAIPVPPEPPAPPAMDLDEVEEAEEAAREAREAARDASRKARAQARKAGRHRGDDREVIGGSIRIEKGEKVDDINVMGGSVDVFGEVLGDIGVLGGAVVVHPGAHVHGDIEIAGGRVELKDDSIVDGDVDAVGGKIDRSPKAQIGGDIGEKQKIHMNVDSKKEDDEYGDKEFFAEVGSKITSAALLFMFGCVLLALATGRVEKLKLEAATRTMRSFALGIVGTIAALATVIALCVTIIGIPVALGAVCAATILVIAALTSVLTLIGEVMVRHRTENPYVHLAVGCLLFHLVQLIPVVGAAVAVVVLLVGVGTLVATRAAGLVPNRVGGAATAL